MAFKPGHKPREKVESEMKDCVPRTKKTKELMYPYAEVASPFSRGPGVVVHDSLYSAEAEEDEHVPQIID
jgi:hypothetical protein